MERSTLRTLVRVAGWILVAPFVLFVVLRLAGFESHSGRFFGLVAVTAWLLVPAWLLLPFAIAARDVALSVVVGLVLVAHLAWAWGDLPWVGAPRPPSGDGTALELLSVNAYYRNAEPQALAAWLVDQDADVLVVVEYTPQLADLATRAGLRAAYPFAAEDPRFGANGSAIFSRTPITAPEVLDVGGAPMAAGTVQVGGAPVRVVAVHTVQPLVDRSSLIRQVGALADVADAHEGPLVLAGDYNANRQHAAFRALLDVGLADAHQVVGRGLARSFPSGLPVVLLDHVVVSPEVGVVAVDERVAPGSDHRAVEAELVVAA